MQQFLLGQRGVGWGLKIWGFCCFQCVLIKFSKGSSNSHRVIYYVPNSTTLLSHVLCPKLFSFHLFRRAERKPAYLAIETSILELPKFQFFQIFKMVQSKWLIPHTHICAFSCPCYIIKSDLRLTWIITNYWKPYVNTWRKLKRGESQGKYY